MKGEKKEEETKLLFGQMESIEHDFKKEDDKKTMIKREIFQPKTHLKDEDEKKAKTEDIKFGDDGDVKMMESEGSSKRTSIFILDDDEDDEL